MAPYIAVEEFTETHDGYVLRVLIRQTDSEQYPSGWSYSLHFGEIGDDDPILRYDNSHERLKGHERHTGGEVEQIEFPGMFDLYDRFRREVRECSPVDWDW